ncbi:MAG: NFACT RNA binding domain-containing protein [Candidatus ainarchaeum sp.]|nr:NFACT RNA binding domain-containing protein [Candidatus ainarchaeum sp.]
MKVSIELGKGIHENAARYYEEAKRAREKAEGVRKAMEESRKRMGEAAKRKAKAVKVARKREWFEEFHWSFTNAGKLILAGKTAQQNDKLFGKMEDGDLFFHADIKGAAATILKDGAGASEEEKKAAAAIAASYSKAWGRRMASVDVYAVKKGQLSKHATGGFVGAGGFAISGEREWFKNTKLMLAIGLEENGRVSAGSEDAKWIRKKVLIVPGKMEKKEAAEKIGELLGVPGSEIMPCLPSGKASIVRA